MSLKLIKVRQRFQAARISDVPGAVRDEMAGADIGIREGSRIAISVGSRGIANLSVIVETVARAVIQMGGEPFIVPAMGSHGGAVAEGQKEVLASLGISEETLSIPVLSSMETVELPGEGLPNRVYMDKYAFDSDGVILVNRIKPHTDFHGPYESGLVKMCVIGLGKHDQALEIHRLGVEGLRDLTPTTAKRILSTGKIVLGLAIVENAFDETCLIKALKANEILDEEPRLLELAKENMPSLPVGKLDVLLIDRMGKDISGTGVDPNIIGRLKIRGQNEPMAPGIKNIVIDDITPGSHGNAIGVGFADVITRKLFGKIDFSATYENVITSTFLERGKIPVIVENAEKALHVALRACGPLSPGKERIARIRDTLHLEDIYVSEAVFEESKRSVDAMGNFEDMFDEDGELLPF